MVRKNRRRRRRRKRQIWTREVADRIRERMCKINHKCKKQGGEITKHALSFSKIDE